MAIHGIISTYFGDLEFDIGKSLNWTKTFCDTMYVMDIDNSQPTRQYVIDWDYSFPTVKKSFFSDYSFLTNSTDAKNWRKESFNRAKAAWDYSPDDWVLFIDGTEGLNVYHAPPVALTVTSAELIQVAGVSDGKVVFTTSAAHGAAVGNTLKVLGASLSTTISGNPVVLSLDGTYLIEEIVSTTKVKVTKTATNFTVANTALVSNAEGYLTKEPSGYFEGNLFQSWINREISLAVAAGKNFVSLDGWALVRSGPTQQVTFDYGDPADPSTSIAPRSEEYYVSMGNMIRLGKVSSFSNPAFNWLSLDQPEASFSNAVAAENLSLISYAYARWSDNPQRMTQSVDSTAPYYVSPTNPSTPPLRPVTEADDAGFAMRRFISNVRPISGLPLTWNGTDPSGTQPMVGAYQKLDLLLVPGRQYVDGAFVTSGYNSYGGTPLYPGVIRKNLREGIWYVKQGPPPSQVRVTQASLTSGVATVTTATPHYFSVGTTIALYGTDKYFNGTYTIASTPTPTSFTFNRPTDLGNISTTSYALGQAVTIPATFGPIPWNYLLNSFGVDDPAEWLTTSENTTPL